jgi:hypothetical protein
VTIWASDTWQWWLEHGFDGIGAGIVGGLVTWFAVVWTLRSERRSGAEAELRVKAGALMAASRRAMGELIDRPERHVAGQLIFDVQAEIFMVEAAAVRVAPELARDLAEFSSEISSTENALAKDIALITRMSGDLTQWMSDPKAYRKANKRPRNRAKSADDLVSEVLDIWASVETPSREVDPTPDEGIIPPPV